MKGCLYVIIMLVVVTALCGLSSGFLSSLKVPTLLDGVLGQPAMPTVSLPPERITPYVEILGFKTGLTNTLLATLLADVFLIVMAFFATRKIRAGSPDALIPRGLQNVVEAIIEVLYGFAEAVLQKRARQVFWLGATIFLLVWVANWMELLPGVDAIGWLEKPHEANIATYCTGSFLGLSTIKGPVIKPGEALPPNCVPAAESEHATTTAESAEAQPKDEHAEGEHETGYILVPFVRAAATDLNMTLSLAIIAMVMVQVYGFRALGAGYLGKFINTAKLNKGNPMGLLDIFVGVLETISEFSKIISFTFRLFGNIFAGQVLLFVMGFLIPFLFFGILIFWGLEIFVGVIQAFVFMILTFVFVAQAMTSHGDHAEHAESH